ncbi:YqaA family protein [Gemmobacter denitrificans]|uniref:YqaA family protein n=1 Tax=Gemmobacter denitrificans TaxID=3123040 RepID=A0ABU8BRL3_9RHOB
MIALSGLFLAALLAATVIPAQSELVFAGLQLAGGHPLWLIWLVATCGNVLGSVVTYAMGRGIERFRHHRWFPATPEQMQRAQVWYGRWGAGSLLLSWAPGGDVLVLMAGVMRLPVLPFLMLTTLAKGGRYAALAAALAWGWT